MHEMHGFDHDWSHGPGPGGGGGPGMLFSALDTLFWIVLCLFLAWIILRWLMPYLVAFFTETDSPEQATARPSALEILRQRYASGEIDAVTFEQMRERLEASYQEREQYPPS